MSGIFKTGFDGYDDEIVEDEKRAKENKLEPFPFRLRVNETKEIIILDDTGFRFYEHSFFNNFTKRGANFTSCEGSGKPDFLVEECAKKPHLVTVMSVKDMSGYRDNQTGNMKGVGDVKPFKLKRTAAKMISTLRKDVALMKAKTQWEQHNERCLSAGFKSVEDVTNGILKKGDVLKGVRIRVQRYGDKSESSGDNFAFIEFVNPQVILPEDKPLDYETVYAIKPEDQIKREILALYNGQPPFLIPGFTDHLPPQGQNGGQQNQGQQQSQGQYQGQPQNNSQQFKPEMREEAPTYTADNIPF